MERELFQNVLSRLTLPRLKVVAQACGSTLGGTKSQIIGQLHDSVTKRVAAASRPYRLISIDLGVKNTGVTNLLIPPLDQPSRPIAEACYRTSLPEARVYAYPEFADMAINFTSELISDSRGPVDGVILERQRLHAASGNVPTDVVKANMMEAMVFTALRVRFPGLYLESVPPKSVLQFWRPPDTSPTRKKSVAANYKLAKQLRKSLLAEWLADPRLSPVDLSISEVTAPSKSRSDDIADALVQALTWFSWRRNSHLLVQNILGGQEPRAGLELPAPRT